MHFPFETAMAAIRSSRLRTTLTTAIVAVGIMSIVGIETSIEILSRELTESFGKMGAEMMVVEAAEKAPPITMRQGLEFVRYFKEASVSCVVDPVAEAAAGGLRTDPVASVLSSDANYLFCNGLHLQSGRNFSPGEKEMNARVCIIGNSIARRLFEDGNAVNGEISFGHGTFRVTGVIEKRGAVFGGGADCSIVVPLGSITGAAGNHRITFISKSDGTDAEAAVLRRIRGTGEGSADDFVIRGGDSASEILKSLKTKLSAAAFAIGLITLLGASVGLMNTMLVSVKERKVEIGLRKALGATRHDIRDQFLAEALLLGWSGAAAGIMLGLTAGGCVALGLEASFAVPWPWLLASLLLSTLVSIASGLLPARRAAALPPVEALKEE